MLRTCVPAALIAASSLAGSVASASITTDLMPTVDGAVQSSGVLGISIQDNESNRTSRSGGNNVRNAVYEFDLSSLPADAIITGASFNVTTRLIVSNVGNNPRDITFVTYAGDGVITEADYQGTPTGNIARDESGQHRRSSGHGRWLGLAHAPVANRQLRDLFSAQSRDDLHRCHAANAQHHLHPGARNRCAAARGRHARRALPSGLIRSATTR